MKTRFNVFFLDIASKRVITHIIKKNLFFFFNFNKEH